MWPQAETIKMHQNITHFKAHARLATVNKTWANVGRGPMFSSFGKAEFLADISSNDRNIDWTCAMRIKQTLHFLKCFKCFLLFWDSYGKDPMTTNWPLMTFQTLYQNQTVSCNFSCIYRPEIINHLATSHICKNPSVSQMKQPTQFSSVSGLCGDISVSLVCIAMTTNRE